MDRLDDGGLCAFDYTGIIRHKSKLYVVGDLSLSAIGGLSLPSAGFALATTAPLWLPSIVLWKLGWLHGAFVILALLLIVGAYIGLEVGSADRDKPAHRAKLALAGMWKQPEHIVNSRKDRTPDEVHLAAIVKRPADPSRTKAGEPLQLRVRYRPSPIGGHEFAINDDRHSQDDWEALIMSAGRLNGATA